MKELVEIGVHMSFTKPGALAGRPEFVPERPTTCFSYYCRTTPLLRQIRRLPIRTFRLVDLVHWGITLYSSQNTTDLL